MGIKSVSTSLWSIAFLFAAGMFWGCASAAAAAQEAARVIAATPGVFVERQGQRSPMQLKDAVFTHDVIVTDATGKAQLLFNDDTTLAVAPDSVVDIAEFSFGDSAKPAFGLRMSKGMTRIVTGRIVEQNREGFNVTTPHATVGIRGTIFSPRVTLKDTTVVVTQIGGGHTVSVTNRKTGQISQIDRAGMTAIVGTQGNAVRPATPQELAQVQSATRRTAAPAAAARPAASNAPAMIARQSDSNGVAALTTAVSTGIGDPTGGRGISGAGGASDAQTKAAVAPPATTASLEQAVHQAMPNMPGLTDTPMHPGLPEIPSGPDMGGGSTVDPGALTATYSGSLSGHGTGGSWNGGFSFDMNLGSLNISNGAMNVGAGDVAFSATGGTGSLDRDSNRFSVSDFTHVTGGSATGAGMKGQMTGSDMSSVLVDQWHFDNNGSVLATGNQGSGTRQPAQGASGH